MEIFGKSESDRITEQIHHEIGQMNSCLRKITDLLDRDGGVIHSNRQAIATIEESLTRHYKTIDYLLVQLSNSQIINLRVQWMDGRYLSLFMWEGSFKLVLSRIVMELDKYEKRY